MAVNAIDSTSGTGPTEMSNSPNSPGPIWVPASAVQVTEVTASLIVVSPSVTGAGSVVLVGVDGPARDLP